MDWEAGKRGRQTAEVRSKRASPELNESSREGTNPGPLRKGPCTTWLGCLLSLSRGCLIRQVGIEGPQSVLQRSVWIGASLKRLKGAINIHLRGTFRKSEAGDAPVQLVAWLQLASCSETQATTTPPRPLRQSRAVWRPAPPSPLPAPSASRRRQQGHGPGAWGFGRREARAPGARSPGSDRRAPVSASRPPDPPPQRPGMPSEPGCSHQGRSWAPRAPRTWAAPPRPGLAPAGMEPARSEAPPPGQSQAQSQGQPVPTAPRGAAGKRGWG